jgi:serine protease Do
MDNLNNEENKDSKILDAQYTENDSAEHTASENTSASSESASASSTGSTGTAPQGSPEPGLHSGRPMFQPKQKTPHEHKAHPVMTAMLCAVIGLGAGFGGGYLAFRQFGSSKTVIYQDVSSNAATSASAATTTSAGTSSTMTLQDVAAKAQPSVVEILVDEQSSGGYNIFGQDSSYTSQAAGSGVIISSDGYIITNNHVIENATKITVTLYDGKEYDATLVGTDSKSDIAVIKIDATGSDGCHDRRFQHKMAVGDTAVVIGNPLGTLGGTVTNGIISATDREVTINNESMNLIQTNAAINSGNSGGGLFDGKGNLIGIVNAKDSGTTSSGATIEGLGFAIPINDAMDVAQQLMTSGYGPCNPRRLSVRAVAGSGRLQSRPLCHRRHLRQRCGNCRLKATARSCPRMRSWRRS